MVAPFAAEECEVDLEDDPSWICMEPHTSAEFNVFYVSPTTCKKLTKSFMSWMQFHFTGILDTTTKKLASTIAGRSRYYFLSHATTTSTESID
jgi:hypothetical protein